MFSTTNFFCSNLTSTIKNPASPIVLSIPFGSGTLPTVDSYMNVPLTIVGGITTYNDISRGYCLSGASGNTNVSYLVSGNVPIVDEFSISFWLCINPNSNANYTVIGGGLVNCFTLGNNELRFNLNGENEQTMSYTPNRWQQYCICVSSTQTAYYQDDEVVLVDSGNTNKNILNGLTWGGDAAAYQRNLNGYIDDITIYNIQLTYQQVYTLYKDSLRAPKDSLVQHYKFNNGDLTATTINDYSTGVAVAKTITLPVTNGVLPTISTSDFKVGSGSASYPVITTNQMGNIQYPTFTFPTNGTSICVWVKVNAGGGSQFQTAWSAWNAFDGPAVFIRMRPEGMQLSITWGSGKSIESYSHYCNGTNDGEWHHYTWVNNVDTYPGYDSVYTHDIYVDGIQVGFGEKGTKAENYMHFKTISHTPCFGYVSNATPPNAINLGAFCGNIDDFRMYSRVLNSVEVNAIYKNTV